MKRTKNVMALILAALMLCAAFAGCAEGKKKEAAHGWVNHYLNAAPSSLNHHITSESNNSIIINLVTTKLYDKIMNEDYTATEYVPAVAADFPEQIDTTGNKWRIKLRKDFMWADGSANITADDVIYSMQMCLDPILYYSQANGPTTAFSAPVNAYEYQQERCTWEEVGIKKVDDYTIEFITANATTSKNVMEYWGAMNATRLVHKPTYEAGMNNDRSGTTYGTSIDTFVSSGPFMVTEWIPDAKITLERNPYYPYADRFTIEGINYQIIPDANTALEIFLQGGIDCVSIDPQLWEAYEDDPRVYEYFDDSLMYMFINLGNPEQNGILGNWNFRDAIYWGTDRVKMCDVVRAYPASRYVRNSVIGDLTTGTAYIDMPGATDFIDDPYDMFKPEKANASLTKALEECGLTSAGLELMYPEGSATSRARNEMIQQQYNETFNGKIKVSLRAVPSGQTTVLRRWNPSDPTSFEATIGSLYPLAENPLDSFDYFRSDYNPPRFCYSNPEYDALYARAESREGQENNELLLSLCYQMEKIILDERVVVPMYETPNKILFSERIQINTEKYVLGMGLAIGSGYGYPQYVSVVD